MQMRDVSTAPSAEMLINRLLTRGVSGKSGINRIIP